MSWRNELTVGLLRAERIFYGTSNGGLGSELSVTELGWLDGVTPGTGAASKALVLDASADITSGINDFTVDSTLYVGVDDTTYGKIYVYGGPESNNQGGFIRLYTSDEHDADDEYFAVNVTSALMWIGAENDLDQLIVYGSAAANGAYAGTVRSTVAVYADSTLDVTGIITGLSSINAGSSGNVGSVKVYPATASRGYLALACTDQTGNTAVTINANAMGQATVVNMADPGAAAAYMAMSTAALSLAEMDVLDGATAGTSVPSKALVCDGSNMITVGPAAFNAVTMSVGTNGSAWGEIQVYGNPTGGQGGQVFLHTDDTEVGIASFALQAYEDDLYIGPDTDTNALIYDGANSRWEVTAASGINIAGTFLIGGTAVTATAAELNFLASATAGTQVASKAVIADANINIGIVKATELHIGATGAEVQVTSTPAELNKLDGVLATATNLDEIFLNVLIPDVSSNTYAAVVLPAGDEWDLRHVQSVLYGTIATADDVLTFTTSTGVITNTLTIGYSGSAAGDLDTMTPGDNARCTGGTALTIANTAASTNSVSAMLTLKFQRGAA